MAEESTRLGPFRVHRFAHVARELVVRMWSVRCLGSFNLGSVALVSYPPSPSVRLGWSAAYLGDVVGALVRQSFVRSGWSTACLGGVVGTPVR
ncbi:hypothetical protein B296_00029358 [Ensete ventricosum]|uniref:Uncharacterized protein n=1 Tax=Ensete ventricosum TaxID=4639 RepID=A0A427ALF5_ENSVE|nr:hypothetical protein B296_00029358 [Ensete ventricosum]